MTALASVLAALRCARASLDDAASELPLTDRHDRDLLAETLDRIERDVRAVESALEADASAAAPGLPIPSHRIRRGGTSLSAADGPNGPVELPRSPK